ncbi:hypothetical protein ANANG_G00199830 [Anguilla anguilla]|uniref:Uncharacterized protein n=1 Tax=Anguilla anguilla TaxID=7936 RepID=A0A9D3RSP6_ANGAN|nr:hypothetical protein ANANG_G00199830 [Anguilla anguilla]
MGDSRGGMGANAGESYQAAGSVKFGGIYISLNINVHHIALWASVTDRDFGAPALLRLTGFLFREVRGLFTLPEVVFASAGPSEPLDRGHTHTHLQEPVRAE